MAGEDKGTLLFLVDQILLTHSNLGFDSGWFWLILWTQAELKIYGLVRLQYEVHTGMCGRLAVLAFKPRARLDTSFCIP